MSKDTNSWFGIKLTQKQAFNLFILSLLGVLLLSFLTFIIIYQYLIMTLTSSDYDSYYYFGMFMAPFPFFLIIIAFLILSIYSLIASRRIAKFYSELLFTRDTNTQVPLFCSNCGNKIIGAEKFCKICGQERK